MKSPCAATIALLLGWVCAAIAADDRPGLKAKCLADDWQAHTSCVFTEVNASLARLGRTVTAVSDRMPPPEAAVFRGQQRRWDLTSHRACEREADEDCPTSECAPVASLSKRELEARRDASIWKLVYGYCIDAKVNRRDRELRLQFGLH